MKIKRLLAVFLLICVLLAAGSVSIFAARPTYEASKQYKNSKYYQNLIKTPLSGDQDSDVVAIALSQLGYREGNGDNQLGGTSSDGIRDFVEFNVLYGKIDNNQGNGLSYGYYWCASFVNWCLRQAGVSVKASAAAEISCRRWLQKCQDAGIYREKLIYSPVAGDLIFFKDSDSLVASTHMGIVLYSDAKNVYTIEGNTTDDNVYSDDGCFVALKSYRLNSSYIVGYAHPDYTQKEGVGKVDYSGKELSAGMYVSKSEINIYVSREMSGDVRTIPAHEVFTVKEIFRDGFRVEYTAGGTTVEGYAPDMSGAVQMNVSGSQKTVEFLDEDGSRCFATNYLLPETQPTVPSETPSRPDAGFVGWRQEGSDKLLFPGEKISVSGSSTTLYAVWDTELYTVTFKGPDGNVISEVKGYFGEKLDAPTVDGLSQSKKFLGWGVEVTKTIEGNATYYALIEDVDFGDFKAENSFMLAAIVAAVAVIGFGLLLAVIIVKRNKR